MTDRVGYCRRCGHPIVMSTKLAKECPNPLCKAGNWRSAQDPEKPYTLTHNDKAFLRSIRVEPTEE